MSPLIANKFTEKDIRQWLSEHGFYGNSAKFVELELHAIQRPGWLQVFRFQVEAKAANGGWETYFGAVRDDERTHETTIKTFRSYGQQQKILAQWSRHLIRRQSSRSDELLSMRAAGATVFLFIMLMFLLAIVVDRLN
ncbi:MAG: hypothetical protein P8M80_02330 [Pirellulaceae bacterium]|nr:hypothetical protein [Pirellulaceae bacterium]